MRKAFACCCVILMAACSSDEEPPKDHVFRTQTDALKKAEQVEKKIQDKAEHMRQQLDEVATENKNEE